MKYGAKRLQWAEITAEEKNSAPTYGSAINLGALNRVADTPSFNEAKGYGDNALKVHVNKFREAGLDVEVTELSNENAAKVLGASIESGDAADLKFSTADNAPYGGIGFYINKMLDDNTEVFQGIFYPRVKAAMQGEEYSTQGENITLANSKLRFTATACNTGDWKILSPNFETEAEASEWVDGQFTA